MQNPVPAAAGLVVGFAELQPAAVGLGLGPVEVVLAPDTRRVETRVSFDSGKLASEQTNRQMQDCSRN